MRNSVGPSGLTVVRQTYPRPYGRRSTSAEYFCAPKVRDSIGPSGLTVVRQPIHALTGVAINFRPFGPGLLFAVHLMPTTIESGPIKCSTLVSRKPASRIHPEQSFPV